MMDLQTKAVCQAKHSQTEVTAGMEQAGKLPSQFLIYSLDIKDRISEVKNFDFNYFQSQYLCMIISFLNGPVLIELSNKMNHFPLTCKNQVMSDFNELIGFKIDVTVADGK